MNANAEKTQRDLMMSIHTLVESMCTLAQQTENALRAERDALAFAKGDAERKLEDAKRELERVRSQLTTALKRIDDRDGRIHNLEQRDLKHAVHAEKLATIVKALLHVMTKADEQFEILILENAAVRRGEQYVGDEAEAADETEQTQPAGETSANPTAAEATS